MKWFEKGLFLLNLDLTNFEPIDVFVTVIVSVRNNFMSLAVTVTKRLMVSPAILDLLMILSIGKLT